jgi:RNA polymerase sigma-70 factor (ECF subfamily)
MIGAEAEGVVGVEPVSSVVSGEPLSDAFGAITRRDVDRAYRLAWAILGNDADAEDATQDALTAAWQQRRTLRDRERLDAWLGRIVINKCRDRLRSRSRGRERVRSIELVALPSVADGSHAAADRDQLDRALRALNPDQRIVVVLRFWADLTVDAISDRLGVPPGTVKSRLHHSLNALRSTLEETDE